MKIDEYVNGRRVWTECQDLVAALELTGALHCQTFVTFNLPSPPSHVSTTHTTPQLPFPGPREPLNTTVNQLHSIKCIVLFFPAGPVRSTVSRPPFLRKVSFNVRLLPNRFLSQ